MTLLELAHYKGMTIQTLCKEIKRITGYELPCTRNVNVGDTIVKKIMQTCFTKKQSLKVYAKELREKNEDGERTKESYSKKNNIHDEIQLFESDDDEIITVIKRETSDCVVLDFLGGGTGTLMLQKSNFPSKKDINNGNIVGLEWIPDNTPDKRYKVCYVLTKEQWQKAKIEKAYKEKKVILGKVLYPYKDQGVFVNIYGKRALMFNNQMAYDKKNNEGEIIKVAICSVEYEGIQYRINVTQKWVKHQEKAQTLQNDYESIHEGEYLDTIINRIEEKYIIVKYNFLSGIIYRSDLFWCKIKNINDHLEIGNPIRAKVVSKKIDENGNFNVRLSHKEFSFNPWENDAIFNEQDEINGTITTVNEKFFTIKIAEGIEGVLYASNINRMDFVNLKNNWRVGDEVGVIIKSIDKDKKKIELCTPKVDGLDEIWDNIEAYYQKDKAYKSIVIMDEDDCLWVQLQEGIEASINKKNEMRWPKCALTRTDSFSFGSPVNVFITRIDKPKRKIFASIKQLTPNPWEAAIESIVVGDTCIVEVVDRNEEGLIVETKDHFHLIGRINESEISWFPLKQNEEPQKGWKLEAKVMIFQPERYKLELSIRQLQEDPWNNIYLGAEVLGTIQDKTESTFIYVQLENKLFAKTYELELYSQKRKTCSFKIVSLNRAAKEIIVSHNSFLFDKQTEEIVKSFFNV